MAQEIVQHGKALIIYDTLTLAFHPNNQIMEIIQGQSPHNEPIAYRLEPSPSNHNLYQ
jgi:hypothetical protein